MVVFPRAKALGSSKRLHICFVRFRKKDHDFAIIQNKMIFIESIAVPFKNTDNDINIKYTVTLNID
jgi:hypothetical protein